MALDLRKSGLVTELSGIDSNPEHTQQAVDLGLVDVIDADKHSLSSADLIVLAIPVSSLCKLLPSILDTIKKDAVVIDTGSTKSLICRAIAGHRNREQFVASHPIAGTENSGPSAAFEGIAIY